MIGIQEIPVYLSSVMDLVHFTLQHAYALDFKTGGLVIHRHSSGKWLLKVWSQVVREPIVKAAESKADGPGLRADLDIQVV